MALDPATGVEVVRLTRAAIVSAIGCAAGRSSGRHVIATPVRTAGCPTACATAAPAPFSKHPPGATARCRALLREVEPGQL